MNESKRRFPLVLLTVLIVLVVLGAGVTFLVKYMQKQQWMVQYVYTPAMVDAQKLSGGEKLQMKSLMSESQKVDGIQLYNVRLFPEVHTVIATVDLPKEFEKAGAYLITKDNVAYPAGFDTENAVKYGIAKAAFENVDTDQFVRFDLVDRGAFDGPYDPDMDIKRYSFTLTPPEKSLSSDASSSDSDLDTDKSSE